MQSNNTPRRPLNGRDGAPELPPAIKNAPRFKALREWWNGTWDGGVLHRRWDELGKAPKAGWHGMAHWIKAMLCLVAVCSVILLLAAALDVVDAALHRLAAVAPTPRADDAFDIWDAVHHPVRAYLDQRAAHLAVSGPALWVFWQVAGLVGLIGGFAGSAGARITWLLWGCLSVAMVWTASPTGDRAVATGLAALMWGLASIVALRGLSLRPVVHNHSPVFQPEFRPELHLHASIPDLTPPGDGATDNVHQLQR